jgi:hypothetical protein
MAPKAVAVKTSQPLSSLGRGLPSGGLTGSPQWQCRMQADEGTDQERLAHLYRRRGHAKPVVQLTDDRSAHAVRSNVDPEEIDANAETA